MTTSNEPAPDDATSMSPRLRGFRDGDDEAILAIHINAIMAIGDEFYSLAQRQSWAHGLNAERYGQSRQAGETYTIATDENDRPIGFCSWSRTQIIGLYVAANRQGSGIGSALLVYAEGALRGFGVATSHIHSSLPAVRFYQAHGYQITAETSHASRGGLLMASVHLEKPLAP